MYRIEYALYKRYQIDLFVCIQEIMTSLEMMFDDKFLEQKGLQLALTQSIFLMKFQLSFENLYN